MVYPQSEKFIENDGQDISRNKTGKQQFLGQGLYVFNNSVQELFHGVVFQITDRFKTPPGAGLLSPVKGFCLGGLKCGRFTINLYFCIPALGMIDDRWPSLTWFLD
jgi:hypothetical protein